MPIYRRSQSRLKPDKTLKRDLFEPVDETDQELDGVKRTIKSVIINVVINMGRVTSTKVILTCDCQAHSMSFFTATIEGYVYVRCLDASKSRTAFILMHPALDPTANSRQSFKAISVTLHSVWFLIEKHLLETLYINKMCVQTYLLTSVIQRRWQQRKSDF